MCNKTLSQISCSSNKYWSLKRLINFNQYFWRRIATHYYKYVCKKHLPEKSLTLSGSQCLFQIMLSSFFALGQLHLAHWIVIIHTFSVFCRHKPVSEACRHVQVVLNLGETRFWAWKCRAFGFSFSRSALLSMHLLSEVGLLWFMDLKNLVAYVALRFLPSVQTTWLITVPWVCSPIKSILLMRLLCKMSVCLPASYCPMLIFHSSVKYSFASNRVLPRFAFASSVLPSLSCGLPELLFVFALFKC